MINSGKSAPATDTPCALICYQGDYYNNLGDDIQALAALQYLKHVDHYVPIDQIGDFEDKASVHKTRAILNGWYTSNPDSWPPSNHLAPLFISFHVTDYVYPGYPRPGLNANKPAIEVLFSPSSLDYFKEHEPVGCRDLTTMRRMHENGIDAYFSGCLTLTLKSQSAERFDSICLVDVACDTSNILATVPSRLRQNVRLLTHNLPGAGGYTVKQRLEIANSLLKVYGSAAFVVTSRLHCALPCLALGTPVLFVRPKHDLSRFPGLLELMHHCSAEDLSLGLFDIPWSNPEPNPVNIAHLSEILRARCTSFMA